MHSLGRQTYGNSDVNLGGSLGTATAFLDDVWSTVVHPGVRLGDTWLGFKARHIAMYDLSDYVAGVEEPESLSHNKLG